MTIRVPLRVRQKWAANLLETEPTPPTEEDWLRIIETLIEDISDYAETEDAGCPC